MSTKPTLIKKKPNKSNPYKKFIPNTNNILNISSIATKDNIIVQPKDGYFNLQLYQSYNLLYNDEEYVRYVKSIERMVRTSDYYKEYIAILKSQYQLDYCMVLGHIRSTDEVTVEMHHGPLLTLYDIVCIILNYRIAKNKPCTTFNITEIVLREHFKHNIQIVMLSKTVHELVHKGKIFLDPKQAFGNIGEFIEKYKEGLTEEISNNITRYMELAETYKSTDNGLLEVAGMKSWKELKEEINTI